MHAERSIAHVNQDLLITCPKYLETMQKVRLYAAANFSHQHLSAARQ
jgi:hypothetical protein